MQGDLGDKNGVWRVKKNGSFRTPPPSRIFGEYFQ